MRSIIIHTQVKFLPVICQALNEYIIVTGLSPMFTKPQASMESSLPWVLNGFSQDVFHNKIKKQKVELEDS